MTVLDNYMFRPLLAIFRLSSRELKVLLHIVCTRVMERSLHPGFCCVIVNYYFKHLNWHSCVWLRTLSNFHTHTAGLTHLQLPTKRKITIQLCVFPKFVISVRDGHCDYSPLAQKRKSYATERCSGLFSKGGRWHSDIYFNFPYTNRRLEEKERSVSFNSAVRG